jgi:hypothetical protein
MQRLTDQIHDVLAEPSVPNGLAYESSLRAAAATLANATARDVTAVRVIGVLGADDQAAFEALVSHIAEEYGVHHTVGLRGGSFSVRFSRDRREIV